MAAGDPVLPSVLMLSGEGNSNFCNSVITASLLPD